VSQKTIQKTVAPPRNLVVDGNAMNTGEDEAGPYVWLEASLSYFTPSKRDINKLRRLASWLNRAASWLEHIRETRGAQRNNR